METHFCCAGFHSARCYYRKCKVPYSIYFVQKVGKLKDEVRPRQIEELLISSISLGRGNITQQNPLEANLKTPHFLLRNIIGQEAGKTVIEAYLRRRGHSEFTTNSDVPTTKLHAYVKLPSVEASANGTTKSSKAPKGVTIHDHYIEWMWTTLSSPFTVTASSFSFSKKIKKLLKATDWIYSFQ